MLVPLSTVGRVFVVGELVTVFGSVPVVTGSSVLTSLCVHFFSSDDWNASDSGSGESSDDYKPSSRALSRYMSHMTVM